MKKKYNIIYADPPWSFNNKNTGGNMNSGADSHYKTMTIEDICNMPINELSADDAVLCMWWVASMPEEALKVVKAWGFTVKTMTGFTWVKKTKYGKPFFGMGFQTRQGSENCLIAIKGKYKRVNAGIRGVVEAPIENHSKKPDIFRNLIVDLYGYQPRLELFARNETKGWSVFGNEVDNSIEI